MQFLPKYILNIRFARTRTRRYVIAMSVPILTGELRTHLPIGGMLRHRQNTRQALVFGLTHVDVVGTGTRALLFGVHVDLSELAVL